MFKLDDELIKDRFSATSYSFYTDEEIVKLSVKQILNPTAFDHLGKPTSGGIYDKALGVSPFDHRSKYTYKLLTNDDVQLCDLWS